MKIVIDSFQNNEEEIESLMEFLQSNQINFDVQQSECPEPKQQ